MEVLFNSFNVVKIYKLFYIRIQKCMVFFFNVNIMEILLILKLFTFNMQFIEIFSLVMDIVGNDSVGFGIFQIGFFDIQCVAVIFKQQLDVFGFFNRFVVFVLDDFWFGVIYQDVI